MGPRTTRDDVEGDPLSRSTITLLALATGLTVAACGTGSDRSQGTTTVTQTVTSTESSSKKKALPEPCSVLTKEQVGDITGVMPTVADPGTTAYFGEDDAPVCYWEIQGGTTVVSVYLGTMSEEDFLEDRSSVDEGMGDPGVGDASYFNANKFYNQIYVHSGGHAAFIDVSKYDPDPEKARKQSEELAELVAVALS